MLFRSLPSRAASTAVIDSEEAANLQGLGDLLVSRDGGPVLRGQAGWVHDDEMAALVEHWRQHSPTPDPTDPIVVDSGDDITREHEDSNLIDLATDIVVSGRTTSPSALQRRLGIGFARSLRLLSILEELGVVGPTRGIEGRRVLVPDKDR